MRPTRRRRLLLCSVLATIVSALDAPAQVPPNEADVDIRVAGDGSAALPTKLSGTWAVSLISPDGCVLNACTTSCTVRQDLPAYNAFLAEAVSPAQWTLRAFYTSAAQVQTVNVQRVEDGATMDVAPAEAEGNVALTFVGGYTYVVTFVFTTGTSDLSKVQNTCNAVTTTSTTTTTTLASDDCSRAPIATPCSDGLTVTVLSVVPYCTKRPPSGDWQCTVKGDTLCQGDEVACDPDGHMTLGFQDNSVVELRPTTQIKIASFFTEGGIVKTVVLLRIGELSAMVEHEKSTRSDFRIQSPTVGSGVRGTIFRMSYDPPPDKTHVGVDEGTVDVAIYDSPVPPITLHAGEQVEATGAGFAPVTTISCFPTFGVAKKPGKRFKVRVTCINGTTTPATFAVTGVSPSTCALLKPVSRKIKPARHKVLKAVLTCQEARTAFTLTAGAQ